MTDWKTVAAARGLQLTDAELAKLGPILDAIDVAYQSLAAKLTPLDMPATIIAEEALESRC